MKYLLPWVRRDWEVLDVYLEARHDMRQDVQSLIGRSHDPGRIVNRPSDWDCNQQLVGPN